MSDKSIKGEVINGEIYILLSEVNKEIQNAKDQARKGELEWLEICYKRFPHNFVKERILWLKEKNGK